MSLILAIANFKSMRDRVGLSSRTPELRENSEWKYNLVLSACR